VYPGAAYVATFSAGRRSFWGDDRHPHTVGVPTPPWATVRRNYPTAVAEQLDMLMKPDRPLRNGRLLLWHGPTGTDKTTAARALIEAWHGWCNVCPELGHTVVTAGRDMGVSAVARVVAADDWSTHVPHPPLPAARPVGLDVEHRR
jgi:hypothetical protein